MTRYTHGEAAKGQVTRLYRIWFHMRGRCNNGTDTAYADYGGRGIYVDPAWDSYVAFREWALSHGYSDQLQLDRIDNDGPYSPGNCRWADSKTQTRNKRSNIWIDAFGEHKILADWTTDPRCGIRSEAGLLRRIRAGWSPEEAIATVPGGKPKKKRQPKTHCKHGHSYLPDNVFIDHHGAQQCRACTRASQARYKAKIRERK